MRRFDLEILGRLIWRFLGGQFGDSWEVNLEIFLGVVFLCILVVFFGDFHGFWADFLSYAAGEFSCGLKFWTFENVGLIGGGRLSG